jgi:hypothetical protein
MFDRLIHGTPTEGSKDSKIPTESVGGGDEKSHDEETVEDKNDHIDILETTKTVKPALSRYL